MDTTYLLHLHHASQLKHGVNSALAGIREGLVLRLGLSDDGNDSHHTRNSNTSEHSHEAGALKTGGGANLIHRFQRNRSRLGGGHGGGKGGLSRHLGNVFVLGGLGLGLRLGLHGASFGEGQEAEHKKQKEGGVFHSVYKSYKK